VRVRDLLGKVETQPGARGVGSPADEAAEEATALAPGDAGPSSETERQTESPSAKALATTCPPCRPCLIALSRRFSTARRTASASQVTVGRGATARQVSVTSRRSARGPIRVTAERISSSGATGAKLGRSLARVAARTRSTSSSRRWLSSATSPPYSRGSPRPAASLSPKSRSAASGVRSSWVTLARNRFSRALARASALRARHMAARQAMDPAIAAQSAIRKARSRGPSRSTIGNARESASTSGTSACAVAAPMSGPGAGADVPEGTRAISSSAETGTA